MIENQPFERTCMTSAFAQGLTNYWYRRPAWMPLPANTLAEAMAHGMPAVSFDCDTRPRGMIRHDVDALPIPPGDVAGLMSALDRLTDDAALSVQSAARDERGTATVFNQEIAWLRERSFVGLIKNHG